MSQASKIFIIRFFQLITISTFFLAIGRQNPIFFYLSINIFGIVLLLFVLYRRSSSILLSNRDKAGVIVKSILFSSLDFGLFIIFSRVLHNLVVVIFLCKSLRYFSEFLVYNQIIFSRLRREGNKISYPLNIVIEIRWSIKQILGRIGQRYFKTSRFTQKALINTSYLFRDFEEYYDQIINYHNKKGSTINILVAGCADGQEAYSIAAFCNKKGIPVRIIAFDLSVKAIEKAQTGSYNLKEESALIHRSKDIKALSYFEQFKGAFELIGDFAIVRKEVKEAVTFVNQDITSFEYSSQFDFVFARKMLYYLPEKNIAIAINNLRRALLSGVDTGNIIVDGYSRMLYKNIFNRNSIY